VNTLIYLNPTNTDVTASNYATKLKDYYRVLYLNGAVKPETEANPNCGAFAFEDGTRVKCTLTSASTTCSNKSLCQSHPFYVVVSSNVPPTEPVGPEPEQDQLENNQDDDDVILTCSGLAASNPIQQGTTVNAPSLICGNGAQPTGVSWNVGDIWGKPLSSGIYSN
jgi:hypothetical protein